MIDSRILNLTAYTSAGVWADKRLSKTVLQHLISGEFGFTPVEVFVNDQPKGRPIAQFRRQLEARLAAGSIQLLTATTGGEDSIPQFDCSLTDNLGASCIVKLMLPYSPAEVTSKFVENIVAIAEALSDITCAEFVRGHDHADWHELHRERRGRRLFVPGKVDRAYWLTYLSDAYVASLGGEKSICRAPAYACRKLKRGILLQSHVDFLDVNAQPRRRELEELQSYLSSLVKPEDRP